MANAKSSTPPNDVNTSSYSSQIFAPFHDPLGSNPLIASVAESSRENSSVVPATGLLSSPLQEKTWLGRRGRRRRSSELESSSYAQGPLRQEEKAADGGKTATTSTLLWWQRPKSDNDEGKEGQEGGEKEKLKSEIHALPPIETKNSMEASSSPSPSLRSPAAAFLSSMNESLGSPSSLSGSIYDSSRAYSTSPNRDHSVGPSIPDISFASLPRNHSHHGSEGSPFGLASAAARLYTAAQPTSIRADLTSLRPDDEGARIGPNGRYLLGRTIGFGGFSTIREAWDMGSIANEKEIQTDKERMHRVAVKIVYTSDEEEEGEEDVAAQEEEELRVWGMVPSHPNLLPLLHHERIVINEAPPGSKHSSISFLVMPFCEGSLLAFVKSEGQLPGSSLVAQENSSLSRSASLQSTQAAATQLMDTATSLPSTQQQYSRTGSGFIHRSNIGKRVASVPLANVLGRSPSLATSPASVGTGTSSSILRRASSRISRSQRQSNGISFSAAQDVMKQLVEALLCLHSKAGVLHGDLKLENILGQRSVSRYLHSHDEETSARDDADSYGSQSIASLQDPQISTIETICWRVADFGLAKRVDARCDPCNRLRPAASVQGGRKSDPYHQGNFLEDRTSRMKKEKARKGGAGGSLAYTAPESFLPAAFDGEASEDGGEASPFASDMWALGCIFYALCSGKLPFSDSFEPRLQMKIAKGKWEMPNRLKRRQERSLMPTTSTNNANSSAKTREREHSSNGIYLGANRDRNDSFSASLRSTKPSPHIQSGEMSSMAAIDMSASMPALQERRYFESTGIRSTSDTSIIVHEADASFEVENQEEEDVESDEDERLDQLMDGKSKERVEIRLALKRLLEPDPRKRWTIEQLANLSWISGANSTPFAINEIDERLLDVLYRGDLPSSLEDVLQVNASGRRPSLATMSISEHASQEQVSKTDDDVGRGRSKRRGDGDTSRERPAKPIDIDRSTSRSRSRTRSSYLTSSPWKMDSSSFEKKLQQPRSSSRDHWEPFSVKRFGQRSSSVDAVSQRGRSTSTGSKRSASRPRHLDLSKSQLFSMGESTTVHTPSTGNYTESASRSSTSRSRSRARDALHDIASREGTRESSPSIIRQDASGGGEERLWWQRGRKGR